MNTIGRIAGIGWFLLGVLILSRSGAAALPFTPQEPNPELPQVQTVLQVDPAPSPWHGAIDVRRGYLYVTPLVTPGRVHKVRLATTTSPAQLVSTLDLDVADGMALDVCLDVERGFGMVATGASPTRVVKFALDDTDAPPARLDSVELQPGETDFLTGAYDSVHGFLYLTKFGGTPAEVAKIAAGTAATPGSRTAVTVFDGADQNARGLTLDPASGRGWVICTDRIVQFVLGAGPAPPLRESFTPHSSPSTIGPIFHPLTRQVFDCQTGGAILTTYDVSGTAPRNQGTLNGNFGHSRLALDAHDGILYAGMSAVTEGMARYSVSGNRTLPGLLEGPAILVTDYLITTTQLDPVRGFVYGIGLTTAGAAVIPFRIAPGPGPNLSGYVNKLKVKSSAAKSNVKAQVFVFNTGTADAADFVVRTFLSDDDVLSYDDVEMGKPRRVKKAVQGKVRKLGVGGTVIGPVAGRFLITVLDGEKSTGDGNYGDNVLVSRRL